MENVKEPFCPFMIIVCAGLDCAWFDTDNCHCAFQTIALSQKEQA
jgi:hypothetical protein